MRENERLYIRLNSAQNSEAKAQLSALRTVGTIKP